MAASTPSRSIRLVADALVMPLYGTLDRFTAGVFSNGECLVDSLLYRNRQPALYGEPSPAHAVAKALEPGEAERLQGEYLFGGYLFRHYGHFLIESLARVYALKRCPPFPILFSSTHREIMPWQYDTFKLLGLRNPIIKLTRPAIVERLFLSPPGFSLPDMITQDQIEALGSMPAPPLTAKKIWLSRSSHLGGGLLNEKALHPHLEALGWEVVHPQYLSVRKQVALVASSARVAGVDGSAFHTALLAEKIRGRFDIFFLRNTGSHAYTRIADLKGFAQRETLLSPENGTVRFLHGEGAQRFYELQDPEAILSVLRD